ncbi:thermonuclease family protein [Cognatiyoonia sp. IB215182]|uniref:thermonuclease family protein n=1 Tax=Cognatiyoonia sp. IB215182 TaxID=3097353 RepID=UPI002A146F57|nr:thermonuclease family protein [Cognatiyoonia sp. IB215182]MDX8353906.1 thermonuclease family protein [Cognatiyoonia sp. IB215182]
MDFTNFTARVDRVVDGDTLRVFLKPDDENSESLRILALDTEEVSPGTKPVTPLGRVASDRAKVLFAECDDVTVTLPGTEPLEAALEKYRGNFGRLLTYLNLADGTDFQELMIREGLSPYFVKYGRAQGDDRHARYTGAERQAQSAGLGIWDQIANNGSVLRDYGFLSSWWELRGRIIEEYRRLKLAQPDLGLLNTRLDYAELVEIAKAEGTATVFMELRDFRPAGSDHIIFSTGSLSQPYSLFIPGGNTESGADVMRLILTRYRPDGESQPRRSYAYVTGPTKMFPDENGTPEIIVTSPDQITDLPAGAAPLA